MQNLKSIRISDQIRVIKEYKLLSSNIPVILRIEIHRNPKHEKYNITIVIKTSICAVNNIKESYYNIRGN